MVFPNNNKLITTDQGPRIRNILDDPQAGQLLPKCILSLGYNRIVESSRDEALPSSGSNVRLRPGRGKIASERPGFAWLKSPHPFEHCPGFNNGKSLHSETQPEYF